MAEFKIRSPYADKVCALRRLAERTPYPEESKAAKAKADALMRRHRLHEKDLEEVEIDPLIRFVFGWK